MHKKPDSAFAVLCRFLSRREHSKVELEHKLGIRGFSKLDIEQALQKSEELDIQNDERFAAMLARTRLQQGYGPMRIIMELKTHKLPMYIIQSGLAEIDLEIPKIIQKLFKKKYQSKNLLPQHISWLAARGFNPDCIRKSLVQQFTEE